MLQLLHSAGTWRGCLQWSFPDPSRKHGTLGGLGGEADVRLNRWRVPSSEPMCWLSPGLTDGADLDGMTSGWSVESIMVVKAGITTGGVNGEPTTAGADAWLSALWCCGVW